MPTTQTIPTGRGRPGRWLALALAGAFALGGCRSSAPTDALFLTSSPAPVVGTAMAVAEERAPAVLVVDQGTGRILYEDRADAPRFPASLTKMMTLYLMFEALQDGRLRLDDQLVVSANAAARPPAKIGVVAGTAISVRDAAQALAIRSANDVATVVAENLAGSEEGFVAAMNARARSLGMNRTRFANASGLPEPGKVSTARDMALLARALRIRFPQYASFYSQTRFAYNGRTFDATNKLLGKVPGVDGMKTGYIRASGFHLVATAERNGRRLIVVVMGGETGRARDAQVTALLDQYL